jgi:hypothetical protein
LIVIAGPPQGVDWIRTGCGGECNSEERRLLQHLAPFHSDFRLYRAAREDHESNRSNHFVQLREREPISAILERSIFFSVGQRTDRNGIGCSWNWSGSNESTVGFANFDDNHQCARLIGSSSNSRAANCERGDVRIARRLKSFNVTSDVEKEAQSPD